MPFVSSDDIKRNEALSSRSTTALRASHALLKLLIALNAAAGVLLICAFVASFLFEESLGGYYRARSMDAGMLIPTLRIFMVIGAPYILAVHIFLSRLLQMVESVRAGTPFIPENADRLKTLAWCLLVLQLLHLAFGVFASVARAANADVSWSPSISGWLAVLLLFVLARVFEEAARIRDDLEAMI